MWLFRFAKDDLKDEHIGYVTLAYLLVWDAKAAKVLKLVEDAPNHWKAR
jgi:hypothetical protein